MWEANYAQLLNSIGTQISEAPPVPTLGAMPEQQQVEQPQQPEQPPMPMPEPSQVQSKVRVINPQQVETPYSQNVGDSQYGYRSILDDYQTPSISEFYRP